jgi:hypothetical protein
MIEWEETVEHKRRVFLEANYGLNRRTATLDDLRKACEAVGLECVTSEESEKRMRDALAAVDLANGHANEAEARAEKAEDRIAELETALTNAANGIGVNDAGPVVYAANARHDEAAREWEDERAELVRTRQETQDKLSEARRELHELRTKLAAAEAERDAFGAKNVEFHRAYGEEQARARATIADLESRLAALTAPVEGEPTVEALQRMFAEAPPKHPKNVDEAMGGALAAIWRAGHAAGVAAATRDLPRATARDVEAMADEAYRNRLSMDPTLGDMRALADRVAERVRREQCLVTRAVESGRGFEVWGRGNGWNVMVGGKPPRVDIKTSDVARVLAEMLGEVGR